MSSVVSWHEMEITTFFIERLYSGTEQQAFNRFHRVFNSPQFPNPGHTTKKKASEITVLSNRAPAFPGPKPMPFLCCSIFKTENQGSAIAFIQSSTQMSSHP